jgi:hypothetical protein
MNTKQREALVKEVVDAYSRRYPGWTDIEVTGALENRVLDIMVSVKSKQFPEGEICIYRKGDVTIFDSTPELMRYVDNRASRVVTFKDLLVGAIVLFMLAIFAGIVFVYRDQNAIAMVTTAVAGILGTFVGVNIKRTQDGA